MVGAGGVSKFDGDMDDYTEHVLSEMEAAAASADGKIRLQAVEGSSRTGAICICYICVLYVSCVCAAADAASRRCIQEQPLHAVAVGTASSRCMQQH